MHTVAKTVLKYNLKYFASLVIGHSIAFMIPGQPRKKMKKDNF